MQDTSEQNLMLSPVEMMCTVYPRGDNVYALANPHNFQSMFKPGQQLRAVVLDSAALLMSIKQGLAMDPIAQAHLR